MEGKLKIGIVGIGNIAEKIHLPALMKISEVEILAVCDQNQEKAQSLAEQYGIRLVYKDYMELLEDPEVDAIDICTPNHLHSVIAVAALERGKHVFCEKPDAINVSEAFKMKEAADINGKVLMVMRNNRYLQTSSFLKNYIAEGKMGEIYAARCGWQRRNGMPGKGEWFTNKEHSGGGPLIDLGIHMIDLTMWLMGNPKPISVTGCTYNKFSKVFDVEDLVMGFIRFDNGACMQIEFSWISNVEKEKRFLELRGTLAGAKWSSDTQKLEIYKEEYGKAVNENPAIDNTVGIPMHEANLRHFVDVVLHKAEPMFLPQQGIEVMKIIEEIYRSAENGKEIIM